MPKLFPRKLKRYNLRSQKEILTSSTPKSKVDANVECDLPFDENEIALELRREQNPKEDSTRVSKVCAEDADKENKTNLDPVDISADSSTRECTSTSDSPVLRLQRAHCLRESARIGLEVQDISEPEISENKSPEKGREKERTRNDYQENTFAAGGTRVPVVNSLAEIYERFARRITYEESIQKDLESNSDTISLEETLSSDSIDSDSELAYSPQIEEMDRDLLQGYQ